MVFYTGGAIIELVEKNTKRDILTRNTEGRQFDDFATHTAFKPTWVMWPIFSSRFRFSKKFGNEEHNRSLRESLDSLSAEDNWS